MKKHAKYLTLVFNEWKEGYDRYVFLILLITVLLKALNNGFIPKNVIKWLDFTIWSTVALLLITLYYAFFKVHEDTSKQHSEIVIQIKETAVLSLSPILNEKDAKYPVNDKITITFRVYFLIQSPIESKTYVDLDIATIESNWKVINPDKAQFWPVDSSGAKNKSSNRLTIDSFKSGEQIMDFKIDFEGPSDEMDYSWLNFPKMQLEIGINPQYSDRYTLPIDFSEQLGDKILYTFENIIQTRLVRSQCGNLSFNCIKTISEIFRKFWLQKE